MTPEEFATRASKMGYATKKTALAYAKGKDCLTDTDYEELYRQSEKRYAMLHGGMTDKHGAKRGDGSSTSKRYIGYNK